MLAEVPYVGACLRVPLFVEEFHHPRQGAIAVPAALQPREYPQVLGRGEVLAVLQPGKVVPDVDQRFGDRRERGLDTVDEIIAGLADGVLVQSIAGLQGGANLASGDFSISFSGRLIRNGELAEHVSQCILACDLATVLTGIEAVGDDHTAFPGLADGVTVAIGHVRIGAG
ncbi:metallopeptidase TldD-related protein [Kribbella catacumbae]|uniref:metallopeptidase TldD-related protein n=1 Tax=Kribbella catacumbae TaxID=460086 RepID=UPI003B506003